MGLKNLKNNKSDDEEATNGFNRRIEKLSELRGRGKHLWKRLFSKVQPNTLASIADKPKPGNLRGSVGYHRYT